MPETSEGENHTEFITKLLKESFSDEGLSPSFSVERAHRIPGGPPRSGGRSRPILARIHNYKDKELIIRSARKKPISFKGENILFFQDFSQEVNNQRGEFKEVRKKCYQLNLKTILLFPAKLKVWVNDEVRIFETVEKAERWLEEYVNKQ